MCSRLETLHAPWLKKTSCVQLIQHFFVFEKFFAFGQAKGNARHGGSRHRPTKVFEFVKFNLATLKVCNKDKTWEQRGRVTWVAGRDARANYEPLDKFTSALLDASVGKTGASVNFKHVDPALSSCSADRARGEFGFFTRRRRRHRNQVEHVWSLVQQVTHFQSLALRQMRSGAPLTRSLRQSTWHSQFVPNNVLNDHATNQEIAFTSASQPPLVLPARE